MKRFVLLLAFLPMFAHAQSKIEPELKVSYELGVDEYKNQSFGAELILGYRASDQLRIGVGTGIYWCKHLYENASIVGSHYYEEYRETARGCHLNCVTATYNKMYLELVFIIKVE